MLSIPSSLFGGEDPNITGQAIVFSVELVLLAVIAVPILFRQWQFTRAATARAAADVVAEPNVFIRVFGPVYLGVLLVLWLSALPAYFGAVDGITADGTPIGHLGYAVVSLVAAALCVAAAFDVTASSAPRADSDAQQSNRIRSEPQ